MKVHNICSLLRDVPDSIYAKYLSGEAFTQEDREYVALLDRAADNALADLLPGMAAIGKLLAVAPEGEIDSVATRNIGWLINHLSEEVSHLISLSHSADSVLRDMTNADNGKGDA